MSKILLVSTAVVVVLAWLLIVEFGINAGKVHYGVELRGDLDVGGMTRAEARALLKERAQEMFFEPVVLGAEDIGPINVYPRNPQFEIAKEDVRAVDWNPRYTKTIDALMAVGRKDGPISAVSDRFDAYFGGVKVPWQGAPAAFKVTERVIDPIEKLAAEEGLTVDRDELRVKLRQALNEWPRQPFYRIPFE
jgi:hypothetical protein